MNKQLKYSFPKVIFVVEIVPTVYIGNLAIAIAMTEHIAHGMVIIIMRQKDKGVSATSADNMYYIAGVIASSLLIPYGG